MVTPATMLPTAFLVSDAGGRVAAGAGMFLNNASLGI